MGTNVSLRCSLAKAGTGNRQVYICRDHLGSITHITSSTGAVIQELSYDALGRLRNPSTQVVYTPGNEPELFLGRGYSGHEHLAQFGLINMNARLYDPVVGRFLSPDPYVQSPDFSQNFNRYSYCLNNPLKYTDPNGEFWHIVIGAAVGGVANLIMNWGNCDGFWEYAAAFTAGAVGGAATAAVGGTDGGASFWAAVGVSAGAGALTASTNSVISQTINNFSGSVDWSQVGFNGLVGGVSGMASYGAGQWASNHLGNAILGGFQINSPMLSQGINGMIGGAAGGYASGFTAGFMFSGGNLDAAFQGGSSGLKSGAIIGGGVGLGSGYLYAKQNNLDIWNGKSLDASFSVTPNGVVLPKGAYIPEDYIQNPFGRVGSYGQMIGGEFVEMLRIDPGTLPGYKGPNDSHFHLNGGKNHIFDVSKWPWWK